MQFDMNTAQQLLTDANKSFASMLPASERKMSHRNEGVLRPALVKPADKVLQNPPYVCNP